VVLQVQVWRTPEEVAWAKLVERDQVFNNASVIGDWFTAANLPRTAAFFQELNDDLRAMDAASKKPFLRARPYTVEPEVKPCVSSPTSTSYPSGSALQAGVYGELLAELFPQHRAALDARARRAMWGRVLGGVHFPSDIAAGRALVPIFLAECRKTQAFREGVERCRQEIATFLARPSR
jgi:acid phosphatase (class A)